MRVIKTISVILIIATALLWAAVSLAVRTKSTARNLWGRPSNGIQAGIYLDHSVLHRGEPYSMRLRLKNLGQRKRTLSSAPYISDSRWVNFRLVGEGIGNQSIANGAAIEIEPGREADLKLFSRKADAMGISAYKANLFFEKQYVSVATNKASIYVVPQASLWIALIMLESAAAALLLRVLRAPS